MAHNKSNKHDKVLFLSLAIFSILFLPFLKSIPYLDGNIDLVKVTDFYTGGFEKYFKNWGSAHPPLKIALSSLFFKIGGINPYTYNTLGYVFGISGIIAFFYMSKNIFNNNTARISALLLATSPMFLAVGIFSLIDYLLAVLILISLFFYLNKKNLLLSPSLSLVVLTKETGLLLPICILVIESLYGVKKIISKSVQVKDLINYLLCFLPFLVFYIWLQFLKSQEQKPWGDWIFAETADKGAMYTIVNNLISLQFLNKYAYQHWLQLLILNFNWIYWLVMFIGIIFFFWNKKNFRKTYKNLLEGDTKTKTLLVIIMLSICYFFTVLTFQTYTIPRYALPLIPLLLLGTASSLELITTKLQILRIITLFFVTFIVFVSLFFSIDPISTKLWGKTEILGQKVYSLHQHLAGNDGITYNMQYIFIVKKRTQQITLANNLAKLELGEQNKIFSTIKIGEIVQKQPVVSEECGWIFPDPNNDFKTLKILNLNIDLNNSCKSSQ